MNKLLFLFYLVVNSYFAIGAVQPPVGSIPAEDLTASFALYEDSTTQAKAFEVKYLDDVILITKFPEDSIKMYYEKAQNHALEGFLLIKIVRKYKYPVSEDAIGKIKLLYNNGFYTKNGILTPTFDKQTIAPIREKRFSIQQFINFSEKKSAKGITDFFDLYWDNSNNSYVGNSDLRNQFGFDDYSSQKKSLYTCILIHHLAFNGKRYLPVVVPMAAQNSNLDSVYIEVIEVNVEKNSLKQRYWIKEKTYNGLG